MRSGVSWREILAARVTTGDLIRLGASVALALLLWGWVTAVQDPIQTEVFAAVPIEPAALPNALVVVGEVPPVTVTLEGPQSVIEDVRPGDLEPRLDLDDVDGPAPYTAEVRVSAPHGSRVIRVDPAEIPVVVEATVSKTFELDVIERPPPEGNVTIGAVEPEVSEVTVTGPSSVMRRVARVVLPVELAEQTTDFVERIPPVAQDASGTRIPEVTVLPEQVATTVRVVSEGKSVGVIPQVVGNPEEGWEELGRAANPSEVVVDGPPEVLEGLISVPSEPVSIEGARANVTASVGLVLPAGVKVLDPSGGRIEVTVQVGQPGVSQSLPAQQVAVTGLGDGLTAVVEPPAIDIVVEAPETMLTSLRADDVTLRVDVTGFGPGRYRLRPTVSLPPNVEWIRTEPDTVTVTIMSGAGGTRAGATGTPLPPADPSGTVTPDPASRP